MSDTQHHQRKNIQPGLEVDIVLKKDQSSGTLTHGIVQTLLTSKAVHPRGIKVRLTSGQVGRVQVIYSNGQSQCTAVQTTSQLSASSNAADDNFDNFI